MPAPYHDAHKYKQVDDESEIEEYFRRKKVQREDRLCGEREDPDFE
jgi:hypothetical protein